MTTHKTVLVTGGAGYIGSHTTRHLLAAGYDVVVVDNLYSGHRWAVAPQAQFIEADVGDRARIDALFKEHNISAVVHFAGHIVVPESVSDPFKYYRNNSLASFNLIHSAYQAGVSRFIFSSTAAVYGIPHSVPVKESDDTSPINPYGRSKLITEWLLRDLAHADQLNKKQSPFRYVALRYFNVAGAALDGTLGQATPEATHLIKVACEAACGLRDQVAIFGTDYATVDGTCIRDYIHVEDLAAAHVAALDYLYDDGEAVILNCGYGRGYSVREVLNTVQQVSNSDFSIIESDRRPGDPPELMADNTRIQEVLGWHPQHDDLVVICDSAFKWEKTLRQRSKAAGSDLV
jgi:UDP-glucose 4-epimerase